MSVSKHQVENLNEWLGSRLGPLINHGEHVRQLLEACRGDQTQAIIKSAIEVVTNPTANLSLSPQQLEVWKAMLPLLAEHGLMAVTGAGRQLEGEGTAFTKEEGAEYLGFSVRKLERLMKKRQIQYEKFGTGRTSTVRFRRADLDSYRESRTVPKKKTGQ